jgi:hypothetical protein
METVVRYYPASLAAGGLVTFEAVGNFVFLLSHTGVAASLKVSIEGQQMQPVPVGLILKTDKVFSRVQVLNTDSASVDFVLLIGQGDIDYKALVIGNTVTVAPEKSSSLTDGGTLVTLSAEGEIFAANTARKSAVISNPITNGKLYIRFGATPATATNGIEINPGVIYEIPSAFLGFAVRGFMVSSGQSLIKAEC